MIQKNHALSIFYQYSFATAVFFKMVFFVGTLYYITVIQMDPLQLVLVGTAMEASIFIFEIPTGVIADVYSRRLSVIIGVFLMGVGFFLIGLWPRFYTVIIAQIIWGAGYTFTSGAAQAWISDEIGEENAGQAFMKATQLEQFGGMLGLGLSLWLAAYRINLPILLGGGLFFPLGFYLIAFMPETAFKKVDLKHWQGWKRFTGTFQNGVKMIHRRPVLLVILVVGTLIGLYSEGFDRLWMKHLLESFSLPRLPLLPLAGDPEYINTLLWLGIISFVGMALTSLASGAAQRWVARPGTQPLVQGLFAAVVLLTICLFAFSLSTLLGFLLIFYWLIGILRTVINPLYTAWVNHRLDSEVRATVLSMSSQVDAIGQIMGGPLVGVVARAVSVKTGLLLTSSMLVPLIPILGNQLRKNGGEED